MAGLLPDRQGLGQEGWESSTEGTCGVSWNEVHVSLKETSSAKAQWLYLESGKSLWRHLDCFLHNPAIFRASPISLSLYQASALGPRRSEDSWLRPCFSPHWQIKSFLGLAEVFLIVIIARSVNGKVLIPQGCVQIAHFAFAQFNRCCNRIKRSQQAL